MSFITILIGFLWLIFLAMYISMFEAFLPHDKCFRLPFRYMLHFESEKWTAIKAIIIQAIQMSIDMVAIHWSIHHSLLNYQLCFYVDLNDGDFFLGLALFSISKYIQRLLHLQPGE